MPRPSVVVKVGGSLYDLPDLATRLRHWLEQCGDAVVVLIPGGGATTDVIRAWDAWHALGEEKAHWLALRALTLNAFFLAELLPGMRIVQSLGECSAILDPFAFALWDEAHHAHECLPRRWKATSDSLAARVALVAEAAQLFLLKSTTIPLDMDWSEAGRQGFVDPLFAEIIRRARHPFDVQAINLRTWPA